MNIRGWFGLAAVVGAVLLSAPAVAEYNGVNWSIGIYTGSSPFSLSAPANIQNPVLTVADVTDERASFLADPFLIQENGIWYMFFEVGNADTGQGDIAYATSPDGFVWTYQRIVLNETFHLSYPYVFKSGTDYYMIPESGQASAIRLYKATSFPAQWTFVATLVNNVHYVDNSVAFFNNKWWMLTSPDTNDTLRLFFADSLTGPWTEHPSSPLVSGNSHISRCGGRLLVDSGKIYRYAQDDSPFYGIQVRAYEITTLTTTAYAETPRVENPIVGASRSGWNRDGMHTVVPLRLDASTWIASVDGQGDPTVVNKTGWTVKFVDSQETSAESAPATNVLDGANATMWHTEYSHASPPPPHEVQIDTGRSYEMYGFRYTPRQDNSANGNIAGYEFYTSTDGVNWGSPVASGTWPNTSAPKIVQFPSRIGRYFRLRALSEVNGNPWTSAAEVDLQALVYLGNHAPQSVIDAPASDLTIHAGDSVTFAGTGSDSDGDTPLTFKWDFGTSGIPVSTSEDPGAKVFNSPGTFTVSFQVKDSRGVADPTPATRTITVLDPSGSPIPKSGYRLLFVDSQETQGESAPATNSFDGLTTTMWHTQWFAASPPCPHEVQIDLGASYDVTGFQYLPRQDGGTNGRIGQYEFYTSTNGTSWGTPMATGTFANDATEKIVRFTASTGRYVRLRALTATNGGPYTSMAELSVLGVAHGGNQPPDGVIDTPTGNVTIPVGGSVSFTGTGSDPDGNVPLTFRWNFGTGSGIADATVEDPGSKTFNTAGVYTVTFTATDSLGLADPTPATRTVTVAANQAPNGTIDTPSTNVTILVGGTVNFTGTGTDPDGNLPLTFRWNFGAGSGIADATVEDPGSKTFNTTGTYTVTFTVTDALGLADPTPATRVVTVTNNQPPNGTIDTPASNVTIPLGGFVTFTGTGSDPDGNVPLTYRWNFGAGSGIADATVEDPGALQFNTSGTFTVTFTVTDALGLADPTPATRVITVSANQAPNGTIDAPTGPVTISVGGTVSFAGTGTDPDNHLPLSFAWNFGSGSGVPAAFVEDPGPVTFNTAGTFTVTFTVTDARGLADATPATVVVQVNPTGSSGPISRSQWLVAYVDSQETVGENDAATRSIDGVTSTLWHTQWFNGSPPCPHEIQLNMGANYNVDGFRYLPRQDGSSNGRIGQYEFYVSTDGVTWGTPVATGTFANDATEKEVRFTAKVGRFVRLRALTEVLGRAWTSAAEINVLGTSFTGNAAPDGVIDAPTGATTVRVGGTVSFAGTGTDTDNNLPLTYRWNFGSGSGIPDSTLEDPGVVTFNSLGTFTATFTVTDALGLADPTPATRVITVTNNLPPDGTIDTPAADATVNAGDSVGFTGTGSDPENNVPLTFRWNFGAGSGLSDVTVEDPGLKQFLVPGTFTTTFTVTDSLGLADTTPATRVITVVGSAPIPRAGWVLTFFDSQETAGEDGRAVNAIDGNPATMWHTQWSGTSPAYPHEIRVDLGATYNVDGFRYLPRQDGGTNGRVSQYEFYVSTDGVNWGSAVVVGTFANNATEKEIRFAPRSARYVRFRALSEVNGNPWASMAELTVLGR